MLISVKRNSDGKVFTSDTSEWEGIYEIHFCTSYTQVFVQELVGDCKTISQIICPAIGNRTNWVDFIAIQDEQTGEFV